jgi:hypothetical protein
MEIHIKTMITENKYTTMFLALLTMITALSISAVAIYYSVAGLVAIFAAAAVPIMIMGGTLEIAKLVTAVWLHRYWSIATWWLRSYLALSVVVLMFITSMGIFGFLSKAHIEQTSASTESVAQVERLTTEIARQNDVVKRAELKIQQLQTSGTGADANVQAQIDKEQERIDKAFERVQPAIDEQNLIIQSQGKLFRDELTKIDTALAQLQSYIDAGEIKKAQQMVGAKADGAFGPNTATKFREWQDARQQDRAALLTKIEQATNNPQARAAAEEIKRLRQTAERQVADSNALINRLRSNIGKTDKTAEIDAQVDEQNARIKTANDSIDTLTEEKYALETEYRKLEAEVGPIKYIAEFVYGEQADKNMLEKAVTWVIVIIIFVFDPLAVLLLIASQYTFEYHRNQRDEDDGERLRLEQEEYERARAQAIVDNPGFTPSTSVPESDPHPPGWMFNSEEKQSEDDRREDREETEQVDTSLPEAQPSETAETQTETDQVVATEEKDVDGLSLEQFEELETIVIEDNAKQVVSEKEWEALEATPEWQDAKTAWKTDNPTMSLKFFKDLFLKGKIDKLPWEDYLDEDSKKKSYMMKQNHQQIRKTTDPTS